VSWAQWKTNTYNCQCLRALPIPTAVRKCLINIEQRPTYPQQLLDNLPESVTPSQQATVSLSVVRRLKTPMLPLPNYMLFDRQLAQIQDIVEASMATVAHTETGNLKSIKDDWENT